jgi:hypothetical protein
MQVSKSSADDSKASLQIGSYLSDGPGSFPALVKRNTINLSNFIACVQE